MPPRLAEELLSRVLDSSNAAEILYDLRELYALREKERGRAAAKRWYLVQVVQFLVRYIASSLGALRAEGVLKDVRHALRGFSRAPGFMSVGVVTLALGIGANVVVWSVIDQILRRPLGFPEEARLVRVWPEHHFTRERFEQLRSQTSSLELFAAYMRDALTLTGEGPPSVLRALAVSSEHFRLFGATPVAGRAFTAADSAPGAQPVVILSHGVWRDRFGQQPDVVGATLALDEPRVVVGVMPEGFEPLGMREELWVPIVLDPTAESFSHMANLAVAARLAPGVTSETARAELEAIASRIDPPFYRLDDVPTFSVQSYRAVLVGDARPALVLLAGATSLVLLLCCVNLTNLLLARGVTRGRELAVRRAMGAGRARLFFQLMTENVVLGLAGGLCGLVCVTVLAPALLDRIRSELPRGDQLSLVPSVVALSIGLSVAAAVGFGLLPAWRLSRKDDAPGSSRWTLGRGGRRLARGLIAVEIALAMTVVAGAGLLVKSFWLLQGVEPGLRAEGVVTMRLSPSPEKYAEHATKLQYLEAVERTLLSVPGAERVGGIHLLPMTPGFMGVGYSPDGEPIPTGEAPPIASYRIVTPGYRETMGIPLVEGRDLDERDTADRVNVGLINASLARALWPSERAVGREVRFENGEPWFRVVGVIGDVHQHRLDDAPQAEVYVPIGQDGWPSSMFVAVAMETTDALDSAASLRDAVWSVDPDVPITSFRSMTAVVDASLDSPWGRALLFSAFGLLALVLSGVGVYGVTAYAVQQREREISIRMSLGASAARVVRETLADGLAPVTVGLVVGLVGALSTSRVLSAFLFEVETFDPAVYAVVGVVLGAAATVAILVPSKRAAEFRPALVLHADD